MISTPQKVARGFNDLLHNMSVHKAVIQVYSVEEAEFIVDELVKYDISSQIGLPEFVQDETDLNVRVYLDMTDSIASYLYYTGKDTCISLVYVRDPDALHIMYDVAPYVVMHSEQ